MGELIHLGGQKTPRLAPCAVLFLDLLGVRAMTQGSEQDVQKRLVALDDVVGETVRQYVGPDARFPATFFSDTLVVATPAHDDPADAVRLMIRDAAQLQQALTARGFFVRGGLSLGLFSVGDGLIFGPALVEAYELESRHAIHPRIVLSKEAEAVAPRDARLMRDGDGHVFVNYLDRLLDLVDSPDADLEAHAEQVTRRLLDHRGDRRIWEKYRWAAEYHNAFLADNGLGASPVDGDAMAWRFAAFAA